MLKSEKFGKFNAGLLLVLIYCSGCATIDEGVTSGSVSRPQGIYHKVHKGETLWRIANVYNVSVDELISVNNIPNVALIEENQLILIPGATQVKRVVEEKTVTGSQRDFLWPVKGRVLSYFGERRGSRFYQGIRIQSSEGELVRASRPGRVVFADYLSGHANTVIIDHFDGYFTVYSQNSVILAKLDDQVNQGDAIAKAGKRGNFSFVHFEIRKNDKAENPMYFLPKLSLK